MKLHQTQRFRFLRRACEVCLIDQAEVEPRPIGRICGELRRQSVRILLGNEPLAYTSNEGMSVAINQRVATAEADNSSRSHL